MVNISQHRKTEWFYTVTERKRDAYGSQQNDTSDYPKSFMKLFFKEKIKWQDDKENKSDQNGPYRSRSDKDQKKPR